MTTIGVLGAGQLGRMLALAGLPLGMRFRFLDPAADSPATTVGLHFRAAFDDPGALDALATGADVVTYETEAVPLPVARALARRVPVYPPPEALRLTQDRLLEKRFVRDQGFEVAPFAAVDDEATLAAALAEVGVPALLKTRTGGYDGRGQVAIDAPGEALAAFRALGGRPAVLERRLTFDRELALVAVRDRRGAVRFYPPTETRHEGGILASALAPAAHAGPALLEQASSLAHRLLGALDYVGVLAIECFEREGRLIVNELAPRVHNSGHWTIEGAATSQFENHLRAITGLPLGSTRVRGACGVVNLIGSTPDPAAVLARPGQHLHLYGKSPAPGRKLGHVTVRASGHEPLERHMQRLAALLAPLPKPERRTP